MLNARTFHRLATSAYLMFPGAIAAWLLPEGSVFMWPAVLAVGWGVIVCLFGAFLGILFACGRLSMGCPRCDAQSHVSGGDAEGMYLECPGCGELRLKVGRVFGLKVIEPGSEEDDLADYRPGEESPLKMPGRYPYAFAMLFLPVVGSIIAGSMIHEFSFFYVLIPGFWCFAVGCFLMDAFARGSVSDNSGTAMRSRAPFSFWGKIVLWFAFYVLAATFPVGFGIQERERERALEEGVEGEAVPVEREEE